MLDSYIFIPSAITPKIFKTLPVPATLKSELPLIPEADGFLGMICPFFYKKNIPSSALEKKANYWRL